MASTAISFGLTDTPRKALELFAARDTLRLQNPIGDRRETDAPTACVSGGGRCRPPGRLGDCEGTGLSVAPRDDHRAGAARRRRRPDRAGPCRSSDGPARPPPVGPVPYPPGTL